MTAGTTTPRPEATEIAIVGMACRFPGAPTIAGFWRMLRDGVEAIADFTDEDLLARGVPPEQLADPAYVKRGAVLDNIETFDAALFGYAPQEAALLDPQNRLFLECAWEALESGGYAGETEGRDTAKPDIGVFAGAGVNTYFLNNLAGNAEILDTFGSFQVMLANDKDYLATLASYKLNLTGPSVTVQTACSTSLVAVHMACQSLLNGECDLALAGGVAVSTPQDLGYRHQEGMILSPDGRCRPFDAQAAGTLNGAGAGVVLLQPLADALAQGSTILGIIKGSAVNNDGARKVGYTAPGPDGQARVIAEALDIAGVHPDQVGYVEAHGTATPLGDPIEITALTKAFRARSGAVGTCAVGSLKSNMGHTGAAAGVAGLIKATLCLLHRQIPPTLHFQSPNPALGLAGSPFFVNDRLIDWAAEPGSRVAAVSSFGIGGTNAHVVLAENRFAASADADAGRDERRWHILPLSARTPEALARMAADLSARLAEADAPAPADAAHTLQTGRRLFPYRLAAVGRTADELRRALGDAPAATEAKAGRGVTFLLTGHGGQSVGMTRRLFETESVFREALRERAAALAARTGIDALAVLHPAPGREEWADRQLQRMGVSQPAMFIVQMALARLWASWGIEPQGVIGHSSGEYAAACLAGILAEEDALGLVAARGRLMDETAPGGMVALRNSESEIRPFLNDRLSLAVVNAHDLCVVSGHEDALGAFQARLAGIGVETRRLQVSRGAHSCTMDSILAAFAEAAGAVAYHPPRIPYVSGTTGGRVDAALVSRPDYWVRHLRDAVRFADGIGTVLAESDTALLEIGPGNALGTFARAHPGFDPARPVAASLPHPQQRQEGMEEDALIAQSLGRLWQAGVAVDWSGRGTGQARRKVPLPTYPFQRRRCWIDPPEPAALPGAVPSATARAPGGVRRKDDPADWFLAPVWRRSPPFAAMTGNGPERILLFTGPAGPDGEGRGEGLGEALAARLEADGCAVLRVRPGDAYAPPADGAATLRPDSPEDYRRLLADIGPAPRTVVHAWSLIQPPKAMDDAESAAERRLGFHSLSLLGRALGGGAPHDVTVLTAGLFDVTGDEILCPDKSLIAGPALVIPQEYPSLRTHLIDLVPPEPGSSHAATAALVDRIREELRAAERPARLCLRGAHRWLPDHAPQRLDTAGPQRRALRPRGVYLITGGLGGLGLEIAGHLARAVQARLVLVGRRNQPARADWEGWIATHGPDDPTRKLLERLLAFEAAGAEIRLHGADAGRLDAMAAVFAATEAEWGAVNGVVHAAGAIGTRMHQPLDEHDPAQCAEQFAPKLDGVRVLDRLLASRASEGRAVDFCVLMSSMASVLGGLGFAAYAAANAALDTAAQRAEQRDPGRWIAMNWDSWQVRGDDGRGPGQLLRALEMSAAEGLDAFLRVLHHGTAAQTIVTRGDLEPRLRQWVDLPPREEASAPETTPAAPETGGDGIQSGIAAVWRTLLGHERIGPDDNFFDLGGHSLLATQMLSQIRHRFGVALPMSVLFRTPTVRAMAEAVEVARAGTGTGTTADTAEPPRRPAGEPAPLSWGQRQLWVAGRLAPGSAAYNVPLALRLTGRLDRDALGRALDEIVRRHEALRTRFPVHDSAPRQEIAPTPLPLPVLSLRPLAGAALAGAEREALDAESSRPFDLENGPPIRALLLESGPDDHVLLLVMHHIATDGWSISLLMKELVALYEAFAQGRPSPLPDPAAQYADFAHWQRNGLEADTLARQSTYWRERLDGLPERHGLLGDFPLPAERTFRSATVTLPLGADLARRVRAFAQAEGATPFMVLLAAFHSLLFRHTGIDDQAVAISVANRTRHWQEEIFGFFVNMLVLRARPRPDTGFRALLDDVRRTALEAYANQDVPFEAVVEALRPRRRPDQHPLAQIGFVLQNLPYESRSPDGLEIGFVEASKNACPFDLLCSITEADTGAGGDLVLSLEYATELFRQDSIERMAAQYRTLLDGAVAAPDTPLARLPLLPADELQDILERWSRDPAPIPAGVVPPPPPAAPHGNVVDLFDGIAAGQPDRVAVRFGERRLTYAELKRSAERVATHLAGLGLPDQAPVCVAMPRAPELVIAFLGILKAGKVYAPLDPAAPAARQEGIREDLRHPPTLTADLVAAILSAPPPSGPMAAMAAPAPDALAYIIHTSGSTGRPKGAMLTHGGLLALALEQRRLFGARPGDRVLQMASSGFDASVWEFAMALGAGAELVMAPAEALMPGPGLARLLDEQAVTHLTITPSALAALPHRPLPALRLLVSAGAALPADLAKRWEAEGRVVVNAYGPTETTVCATLAPCGTDGRKPLIGRPLAGWSVFVLDPAGNPVPAGVAGELHIGGAGLARGYWERPELTAERFALHPLAGERLYATGDRVAFRRGEDGAPASIEFLGRIDEQIKVRGFRVEPGEIEAHLRRHPAIAQAAVVGHPRHEPGDLAAYLVPSPGVPADGLSARLRADLSAVLPDYMVPGFFVTLDALPLNASGKLDRDRLPDPRGVFADDEHRPPLDAVEAALCALWEAVLGVPRIGTATSFFNAGGTSLLAVETIARIEREFGVALPLTALFRHPTVGALAVLLRRDGHSAGNGRNIGEGEVWSPLVPLAGGDGNGDNPPCFWIPGAGGSVMAFAPLARHLGGGRPVYGLQPAGLDGLGPPDPDMEAMADRALRAIREVQPQGPYWLGGHSFGAKVAFAVAQRLLRDGETVERLTVIDGYAPGPNPLAGTAALGEADWLAALVEELAATAGRPLAADRDRFAGLDDDDAVDRALAMMREHGLPALGRAHLRGMLRVMRSCAGMDYAPADARPVRLLLLRAAETLARPDRDRLPAALAGDDLGWSRYSDGPLAARTLPGDHFSILADPSARLIAGHWEELAVEGFCNAGE
ncbi:hybrid non-ribosomal peptide synthetase/type I polyketide synthase [Azospirillum agricola]|uniref:hybrid non-ribosomal peptide synthetase/type I polyketide synthase n=1 Tax=Azospirillum agricola TaxID=1720247 RepID=UPI000A0EFB5A|nr:hybrid non-ribosomal peptide synthetase/type I polyketide synthase [Azospirillum agricola]SMH62085.1 amino acid adenylation domain-containing protein [Azospirillum lipoferum]